MDHVQACHKTRTRTQVDLHQHALTTVSVEKESYSVLGGGGGGTGWDCSWCREGLGFNSHWGLNSLSLSQAHYMKTSTSF